MGKRLKWDHGIKWVRAVVAERNGDGCRDWPGHTNPKGYGDMGWEGKTRQVGHVVLELSGHPRPSPDHHQMHSCDRPVCAAPWHLRWGTNTENHEEMMQKGRQSKGEHRPQSKLTDQIVLEIRSSSDSIGVLADRYGVHFTVIWKAKTGQTWRHVVDGVVIKQEVMK